MQALLALVIDNLDLWTGGPAMSASQDTGDQLKQQGHRGDPRASPSCVEETLRMGDGEFFLPPVDHNSVYADVFETYIWETKFQNWS